jgi:hypothetical protein
MLSRQERVTLFMGLFKGREDVFARRWQKWGNGVSGYSPVYVDSDKELYEPLSVEWIEKHLIGSVTLVVYPLLRDNTSLFVVADFDGDGWQTSVRAYVDVCKKYEVPLSVEQSRSGNGAHAWVFFDKPYPAHITRRIILALLAEARCSLMSVIMCPHTCFAMSYRSFLRVTVLGLLRHRCVNTMMKNSLPHIWVRRSTSLMLKKFALRDKK